MVSEVSFSGLVILISHHDEGARHSAINGLTCRVDSIGSARALLDGKIHITSDTGIRKNFVVVGVDAEVAPTAA